MGSVVPLSAYRRAKDAPTPPAIHKGEAEVVILQVVRIVRTEPMPVEAGRAQS